MTARHTTLAIAALAVGLVLAQDAYPATAFYHSWQYAAILAVGALFIFSYASAALVGDDGITGRRLTLALAGALVVMSAGLVSGLMGPDTVTVARAPGTVAPLPDLKVAAFFDQADASAIARGNAGVTIRRRDRSAVALKPGGRAYLDASVLYLVAARAAFVEARDARGGRLTITQPANPSFLSPVLLFVNEQQIGSKKLPFDSFAAPGAHRVVKAVYFSGDQTQAMHVRKGDAGKPAVLFAVDDEAGNAMGIALGSSGQEVVLGGLRLRATIGTYPALAIAAAPLPLALACGFAAIVAGLAWAAFGPKPKRVPAIAGLGGEAPGTP